MSDFSAVKFLKDFGILSKDTETLSIFSWFKRPKDFGRLDNGLPIRYNCLIFSKLPNESGRFVIVL